MNKAIYTIGAIALAVQASVAQSTINYTTTAIDATGFDPILGGDITTTYSLVSGNNGSVGLPSTFDIVLSLGAADSANWLWDITVNQNPFTGAGSIFWNYDFQNGFLPTDNPGYTYSTPMSVTQGLPTAHDPDCFESEASWILAFAAGTGLGQYSFTGSPNGTGPVIDPENNLNSFDVVSPTNVNRDGTQRHVSLISGADLEWVVDDAHVCVVPEPSSGILGLLGVSMLALRRRKS